MRTLVLCALLALTATAWGQAPATIRTANLPDDQLRKIVNEWPECDEYLSAERCKVTIYLGFEPQAGDHAGPFIPRAHWDVHVKPFIFLTAQPRGEAAVVLLQASPFISCTVAATPAPPSRDLSANIGSLLTAVGSIGAVPLAGFPQASPTGEHLEKLNALGPAGVPGLDDIELQLRAIDNQLNGPATPYNRFRDAFQKDWKYSFQNEDEARIAVQDLRDKAAAALASPPPDFASLQQTLIVLATALQPYIIQPPLGQEERVKIDAKLLMNLQAEVTTPADAKNNDDAKRKTIRQVYEFVWGLGDLTKPTYFTSKILPMSYFSGKQVTETVSCKDKNSNPVFDNIVFTAYYEGVPHVEISAGAILSLLGGRQVGTVSCSMASSCSTILAYTSKSWYQFMPGVFVEWRLKNFRAPGAKNGSPVHKLGYLWSFGPVAGVNINPNNGTTEAEFFQGVSLGIQRFSIMAGFHEGRYQQFGGGYYVGETFSAGTSVTPPIVRNWAVRPAFGIAYRIPIR